MALRRTASLRASTLWRQVVLLLVAVCCARQAAAQAVAPPPQRGDAIRYARSLAAGTNFFTARGQRQKSPQPQARYDRSVVPADFGVVESVESAAPHAAEFATSTYTDDGMMLGPDSAAPVPPYSLSPPVLLDTALGHAAQFKSNAAYFLRGRPPLGGPVQPRYLGPGGPLQRSSWRNRPWSAGLFAGGVFADDPIPGEVNQDGGLIVGGRIGYDLDHYLGVESRFSFANPGVDYAVNAQRQGDNGRILAWDADVLYYPWGDARWRPFLLWGLGVATYDFHRANGAAVNQAALAMPFGVGIKHRWDERLAIRIDLLDHLTMGSGDLDAMHNITLTIGGEIRFGGVRLSYWPWEPGDDYFD